MSFFANRFTALIDACALYPQLQRDLLLRYYKEGLYRARWSKEIEAEWTRSLKENRPELSEKIDRTQQRISEVFPECYVEKYAGLADMVELPDPNDRHVLAAAIKCGAQLIVTDNLDDFPSEKLAPFDIEAVSVDTFLFQTFDLYPDAATSIVQQLRVGYRNSDGQRFSQPEFIMMFTARGLPQLASALRERQIFI